MSIDKVDNHFVCDLTAATRHCCTVNHFSDCKRHRIFDQFRALQPSDVLDPEGELTRNHELVQAEAGYLPYRVIFFYAGFLLVVLL